MDLKYKDILYHAMTGVGTFLVALSIQVFISPNEFAPGGVTGLSILIEILTEGIVPIWISNLAINLPLFLIGISLLGRKFGSKTLFGIISLSFFIAVIPDLEAPTGDKLLSALFGGALSGAGLGLVFKAGGTTGGSDLFGFIVNKKFPGIGVSTYMMALDIVVVILSGIITGTLETPLYSVLVIYVSVNAINFILNGFNYDRLFYVISDKSEEIGNNILKNMSRGVTILNGKGFYTKKDRDIILVVVSRSQIQKLKDLVYDTDNRAFMIGTDVSEVLGEGFRKHTKS